jgi:hypothetical protein
VRGAWGDGDTFATSLYSAALGADPAAGVHVELAGGSRLTRQQVLGLEERMLWESAEVDLTLGNRWYLSATFERTHGDAPTVHQQHIGLSCSF